MITALAALILAMPAILVLVLNTTGWSPAVGATFLTTLGGLSLPMLVLVWREPRK